MYVLYCTHVQYKVQKYKYNSEQYKILINTIIFQGAEFGFYYKGKFLFYIICVIRTWFGYILKVL